MLSHKSPSRPACLFASIGSQHCNPLYVRRVAEKVDAEGGRLFVCLLDAEEFVNAVELDGLPQDVAKQRIAARCREYVATLDGLAVVRRSSEYETTEQYRRYLDILESVHQGVAGFARMCRNQVYRNLHPRLRNLGVRNSRHGMTARLVPYLLKELAAKLSFVDEHGVGVEYSPAPEMEVETALRSDRFPGLERLPKYDITRVMLRFPEQGLGVEGVCGRYETDGFSVGPIHLTVAAGTTLGIVGPSGAGKSTLLKLIAGHLRTTQGSILIAGQDVTELRPGERNAITVFQEGLLFPHMTLRENVAFGLRARGLSKRERSGRVDHYLRLLELDERSEHRPNEVSGGERQRAALARALVLDPLVLLLDEPTASLDDRQKQNLARLMMQAFAEAKATAMIMVTHDLDFAAQVCDQLVFLKRGRFVGGGLVQDVYLRPPTAAVAELLGMFNIVPGRVDANGMFQSSHGCLRLQVARESRDAEACALIVRSDSLVAAEEGEGDTICGQVTDMKFRGRFTRASVSVKSIEGPLLWDVPVRVGVEMPRVGEKVHLRIAADSAHVVPLVADAEGFVDEPGAQENDQ